MTDRPDYRLVLLNGHIKRLEELNNELKEENEKLKKLLESDIYEVLDVKIKSNF